MNEQDEAEKARQQDAAEKVRENRLRRMADRQGFQLMKSRRRDPRAIDYGGFMICDPRMNAVLAGGSPYGFSMSLDDVEEYLRE